MFTPHNIRLYKRFHKIIVFQNIDKRDKNPIILPKKTVLIAAIVSSSVAPVDSTRRPIPGVPKPIPALHHLSDALPTQPPASNLTYDPLYLRISSWLYEFQLHAL